MENRGISCPVVQTSPGNSNSSNQPSPGAQLHSSPHPPQPVIGINPATGPPVGTLPAVQQVQVAAARQTAPQMVAASVNYGNGNPNVSPPTANAGLMLPTPQTQITVSQIMPGVPNHMLNMSKVTCWEDSGCAQNPQPLQNPQPQPAPQMELRQQTQLIRGPGYMPRSIGNSSMGSSRIIPNPGASLRGMQSPTQTWGQLLQIFKSPSAQQQKQAPALSNSNPLSMAEFVKEATAQQQQQQQHSNSSGAGLMLSAQQQQQALALFKSNLQLMAASVKETTAQQKQQHSNSSNQQSPGAQLHSSPHPPRRGTGMNPAIGHPVGGLQDVQQVQAAAARQTAPQMVTSSVNYDKGNPVVSPPSANAGLMLTTPQMQIPVSQMMSGGPNHVLNRSNFICLKHSAYAANPQPAPQTERAEPKAKCPVPFCVDNKTKLRVQKTKATGSPVGVLKDVRQAQAARQTPHMDAASVNYGKCNTVVSPPTANADLMLTTPQMPIPVSQMIPGVPNRVLNMNSVTCWGGSGYAPNPQPHQNPQPAPQTEKAEPQAKYPAPFCVDIKTELRLQTILHRIQILERRIATMENGGISCPVAQTSPGNSNSSYQPSPGVQLHSSPQPPQQGLTHRQRKTAQKQQLRPQELEQGLFRNVSTCKVFMGRERSAVFQPRVAFFHVAIVLSCSLTALLADLLHIK